MGFSETQALPSEHYETKIHGACITMMTKGIRILGPENEFSISNKLTVTHTSADPKKGGSRVHKVKRPLLTNPETRQLKDLQIAL